MYELISSRQESPTESECLHPLRYGSLATPLFLVESISSAPSAFRALAKSLTYDCPVYGLDGPYLSTGPHRFPEIREQAAHYVELVRRVQAHGPYMLGGYCLGGNVAHEMACQLEAAGERVAALLLFDSSTPAAHLRGERSRTAAWAARTRGRLEVAAAALPRAPRHFGNLIHLLRMRDRVAPGTEVPAPTLREALLYVWRDARFYHTLRKGGLGSEELAAMDCSLALVPAFWREQRRAAAGTAAMARHEAVLRPVGAPIALFTPTHKMSSVANANSGLGWEQWTDAETRVISVSGTHELLLRDPWVREVAREMDTLLQAYLCA